MEEQALSTEMDNQSLYLDMSVQHIEDDVAEQRSVCEDSMAFESRADVEVLRPSLMSLQLRQENDRLCQAVDVMSRAHAKLSEDLTLKNNEIAQSESQCRDLELQAAELSEKLKMTEIELAECKKDHSHCVTQLSELSIESIGLRDKISAANSEITALHCEVDSHTISVQHKQTTIDNLQSLLSAECQKTQLLTEQLSEEQTMFMSLQSEVSADYAKNSDLAAQSVDLQHKLELLEKSHSNLQLSFNELHERAGNENEELQYQLRCLQNDYQLQVQSLNITEEKYKTLQLQCDQLTTENASFKLKVVDENEQSERQRKIDMLEQALLDNENALVDSRNMAEECLSEKATLQSKLLDAEKERDSLRAEVNDLSDRYRNAEKSSLESKERLVQYEQQVREKNHYLNYVQQQMSTFQEALLAVEQDLKCQEMKNVQRKHEVKKLKDENENLKETLTAQNGTIADALRAKEESDKQTAVLQIQTEHLTSEKTNLEQQVRTLENSNSSLQNDLSAMTDSCENAKKLSSKLQLDVDRLRDQQCTLSEQLSSSVQLCEQKDEVIQQLNSEKEELTQSIAALKQTADAEALERTAHIERISELEKQVSIAEDKIEEISTEKKILYDDLKTCKDIIEQKKQSFSDAEIENERCRKVISDFEEQSLFWRDEKLCLEGRVRELESCAASMEKGTQTVDEKQNVQKSASVGDLYLLKNDNVEASNEVRSHSDEHHVLEECEFMKGLKAVEADIQECEEEVKNNVQSDCGSMYNLCPEQNENLKECQSLSFNLEVVCQQFETEKLADICENNVTQQLPGPTEDALLKVEQVISSEQELECGSERSEVSLHENLVYDMGKEKSQPLTSDSLLLLQNEHFEEAVERTDDSDIMSQSDNNVARESSSVNIRNHCNPELAADSASSVAFSESAYSAVCVNDDEANKYAVNKHEDLNTERDGHRRVIKRFTRLSQSSVTLRHGRIPTSLYNSSVTNKAACGHDALEQLPDNKSSASDEVSASSVSEIVSAVNLQGVNRIPASVPCVDVASDAACSNEASSFDVHSVGEAPISEQVSACMELSCPQTVSDHSQATDATSDSGISAMKAEPESPTSQSVIVNVDVSSDNPAQQLLSSKRLSTDVNGKDAKIPRLAGEHAITASKMYSKLPRRRLSRSQMTNCKPSNTLSNSSVNSSIPQKPLAVVTNSMSKPSSDTAADSVKMTTAVGPRRMQLPRRKVIATAANSSSLPTIMESSLSGSRLAAADTGEQDVNMDQFCKVQ